MLKANFLPLSREQLNLLLKPEPFALLREAKRTVSLEFSKELALHSKDILNHIHAFSKESKDQRLLDIYNKLQQFVEIEPPAVSSRNEQVPSTTSTPISLKQDKIKVGDIIDGKRCTGFYRGQPVFSEN